MIDMMANVRNDRKVLKNQLRQKQGMTFVRVQ